MARQRKPTVFYQCDEDLTQSEEESASEGGSIISDTDDQDSDNSLASFLTSEESEEDGDYVPDTSEDDEEDEEDSNEEDEEDEEDEEYSNEDESDSDYLSKKWKELVIETIKDLNLSDNDLAIIITTCLEDFFPYWELKKSELMPEQKKIVRDEAKYLKP
jgi:hypothetical protein